MQDGEWVKGAEPGEITEILGIPAGAAGKNDRRFHHRLADGRHRDVKAEIMHAHAAHFPTNPAGDPARRRRGVDSLQNMRVATANLLTYQSASGRDRHEAAKDLLADLDIDVVALQEVTRTAEFDQAVSLLGPDYTIVDVPGGDPVYGGECLATRCRVLHVERMQIELSDTQSSTPSFARALALIVDGPLAVGPVIVVHHTGTFERDLESVREKQAVATARMVEGLLRVHGNLPVVLLGDFNASPDSSSMRFLTGRQSLAGFSVYYEDAWEASQGSAPGYTFEPRNPLVRVGQMPLERGRRIDHILVRGGAHGAFLDVQECRLLMTEPRDGVWPSDHYGVLADLVPPPHPPGHWAS